MFFFFPFGFGGGGFLLFILLIILGRVLRNLRSGDDDENSQNRNGNGYTHYYYYNFGNNQQQYGASGSSQTTSTAQAYRVLGVPETATEAEIKKAYRKLILEYHPDTVASNDGLSEESKKYATRKFREVQEAYEQICRERGIK